MPNSNNTKFAGQIMGSPLNGLCERICIEVPKVFDGCVSRYTNQTFVLQVNNIPGDAIEPFVYISTASYGEATFEDMIVTPGAGECWRVIGDVVIPVVITFRDSTGRVFSGNSSVRVHRDILLKLPQRTLIPYQIKTAASLVSNIGSFLDANHVSITCCYVIVTKVVVLADVLVPTYGYCVYPDCNSCGGDICNELLNLPLFPPSI